VTSARRLWSNRRNALRSTGPRTGAGKARAARNARRHGLNLSAACGSAWADEIVALARIIAGPDAGAERLELASRIAAAQIDVVRARRARCDLLPAAPCTPDGIKHLAAIVRYERRAFARRNSACRDFDAAAVAGILAKRTQRAKTEKLPHVGVSCARRQRQPRRPSFLAAGESSGVGIRLKRPARCGSPTGNPAEGAASSREDGHAAFGTRDRLRICRSGGDLRRTRLLQFGDSYPLRVPHAV
jgi:hypothetical protein